MAKLHFTDTGKGETALVFLHYFGGAGRTWQPVIENLQEMYRCIAIDLLGFGDSPKPDTLPTANDSRDAVLEVLENLQLSRFTLIGHSMGGKIALAVAAVQPLGLSNVLLFAPSPPTPEPMSDEDRKTLQEAFGNEEKIREHLKKITASPIEPALFDATVADNLKASEAAWNGWLEVGSKEDISADMTRVQVPLKVVGGSEDKSLNITFLQAELSKYFTNASFAEVKNSGHLLPLEKTEEVVAIIQNEG